MGNVQIKNLRQIQLEINWPAHALFWLLFLGFPLIFASKNPAFKTVDPTALGLFSGLYVVIFYLNYLFLFPYYSTARKYGGYLLCLLICALIVVCLEPFDRLVFQGFSPPNHLPPPPFPDRKPMFHLDIMSLLLLIVIWGAGIVFRLIRPMQAPKQPSEIVKATAQVENGLLTLWVEYRQVQIPFADIEYVEGWDDYIKIHLRNQTIILTRLSLKAVFEKLPNSQFIRIHRSYIVSKEDIAGRTAKKLMLKSGLELPVSARFTELK